MGNKVFVCFPRRLSRTLGEKALESILEEIFGKRTRTPWRPRRDCLRPTELGRSGEEQRRRDQLEAVGATDGGGAASQELRTGKGREPSTPV